MYRNYNIGVGVQLLDVNMFSVSKQEKLLSLAQYALNSIAWSVDLNIILECRAGNIIDLKIFQKMIKNSINSLKVLDISNVLNVNFGCKNLKVVTIWFADVNSNFAIYVVNSIIIVDVMHNNRHKELV